MSKLNIVLVFQFFTFTLFANEFKKLAELPAREVEIVNTNKLRNNQLVIAMPFAKDIILNPEQKRFFEEQIVVKIELVYTKHRTSSSFNQIQLNVNRLIKLNKWLPSLFENPFWDYELIAQTNGNTSEECETMFHGFIFTFRPNSSPETLALESDYLQKVVENLEKTNNKDSLRINKRYTLKTRWDDKVGYLHDTIWTIDNVVQLPLPASFYDQSLYKDSTVLNAFERNTSWKNFAVVTDVTGSMSPYTSQVFVWLKKQAESNTARYFVFFNDGDRLESNKKLPLSTGGIYGTDKTSSQEVMATAAKCMKNGSGGGERIENDVEAILFAQKEAKQIDEIVLIADNFESMRDYNFIQQITKPVRVITCGVKQKINIQYLDLARVTKGSIHTFTTDVYNLNEVKQGEKITIDGETYIFSNNRFHYFR